MPVLYGNIVDLPFLVVISIQPPDSVMTYDYIQHICSLGDCFALEVIAEFQAKFPVLNIRYLWSICRYTDFCVNVDGMKEGDNPCKLSINRYRFLCIC